MSLNKSAPYLSPYSCTHARKCPCIGHLDCPLRLRCSGRMQITSRAMLKYRNVSHKLQMSRGLVVLPMCSPSSPHQSAQTSRPRAQDLTARHLSQGCFNKPPSKGRARPCYPIDPIDIPLTSQRRDETAGTELASVRHAVDRQRSSAPGASWRRRRRASSRGELNRPRA